MVIKGSLIDRLTYFYPDDWKVTELRNVVSRTIDNRGKTPPLDEEGDYPLLEIFNMSDDSLKIKKQIKQKFVNEETYNEWFRSGHPHKGDILISTVGHVGVVSYLDQNNMCIAQNIIGIKIKENLADSKYLAYFLKSSHFYKWINGVVMHAVQPSIKVPHLLEGAIPLPPIREQKKISEILTSVEESIEKTEAIIEQTEKVKKGLMQQLLTKGIGHTKFKKTEIGEIPEGWEVKTFNNLIEEGVILGIQDGNHGSVHPKSSDYVESGIPFIMANNLFDGTVDIKNCNYISKDQADKLRIGFSNPGDVLLSHKGTIGRVAIVPEVEDYIMLTPQVTYYRVTDNDKLMKEFLAIYFKGEKFQSILRNLSAQSTRSYIGITNQKKLHVALPSIKEQKKLIDIISTVEEKAFQDKNKLSKLKIVKHGLMQVLLTGKVRVKVDE